MINRRKTIYISSWSIIEDYLFSFDIYHNGRGSEIRSIEEKEDYLLSDEIRPGGLEDNLLTDKLPIWWNYHRLSSNLVIAICYQTIFSSWRGSCIVGNVSLRKSESDEEEMWANLRRPLCCRLTYGEDFSEIKPSGHIYDI